jgi:hypothetical protein
VFKYWKCLEIEYYIGCQRHIGKIKIAVERMTAAYFDRLGRVLKLLIEIPGSYLKASGYGALQFPMTT